MDQDGVPTDQIVIRMDDGSYKTFYASGASSQVDPQPSGSKSKRKRSSTPGRQVNKWDKK